MQVNYISKNPLLINGGRLSKKTFIEREEKLIEATSKVLKDQSDYNKNRTGNVRVLDVYRKENYIHLMALLTHYLAPFLAKEGIQVVIDKDSYIDGTGYKKGRLLGHFIADEDKVDYNNNNVDQKWVNYDLFFYRDGEPKKEFLELALNFCCLKEIRNIRMFFKYGIKGISTGHEGEDNSITSAIKAYREGCKAKTMAKV